MELTIEQETEIDVPRPLVTALFADRQWYPQWQPGLVSVTPEAGKTLATYTHIYAIGRRKIKAKEEVMADTMPSGYATTLTMKGIRTTMQHRFEVLDERRTRWYCKTTYHFRWLNNLVGLFMRDNFRRQSDIWVRNFKRFAEWKSRA